MKIHKKQQEALDSQVKTLTKKKNENENVLKDLESINLKNVSFVEEFKRKTKKVEKEKLMEDKKKYQRTLQHLQAQLEMAQERKKSLDLASVKKKLKDYELLLHTLIKRRTRRWILTQNLRNGGRL